MNAAPNPQPEPQEVPRRAPRPGRGGRIVLTVFLWILGILAVAAIGLAWYASTPSFENKVRNAVIAQLEKSTGGRVTLGHFGFVLSHLEFEVDDLTIHGLEAPGQVPYAHVDRLFVRLQILSFFRAKVGLNYLEADHPVLHLIVYPDGTTNQPKPKHPSTGNTKDEIFNLQIGRTVLRDGVAMLNDRKIPFNLAANNLGAQVSYVPSTGHYVGAIHADDITAQRGHDLPVRSTLDATLEAGRNSARLISLTLQSGPEGAKKRTVIRIAGSLENFANPAFQFTIKGAIDALEIRALTGTPGIQAGIAEIDAGGHGSKSQFVVDGTARVSGAAYSTGTVHISGVTAGLVAHVTQDVIAVNKLHAQLAGGTVDGDLKITNWQAAAAQAGQAAPGKAGSGRATPASAALEQGTIRTRIAGFSIDRILDLVAPPKYRRLGFDSSASGTANVDWTGSPKNLVGAVNITLGPPHPPTPHEIPMTGVVQARYLNSTGTVQISQLDVHTPASAITVSGTLGAYPLTSRSHLDVSLVSTRLDEFNPVLDTLGASTSAGAGSFPAQLHGELQFHGVVAGTLKSPDFDGHLQAANFDVVPKALSSSAASMKDIHFDSLAADASYAAGSLDIRAATLVEGKTTLQLSGDLHSRSPKPAGLFQDSSAVEARVSVKNLDLAQWVALTGKDIPVSGTLNLTAETGGTLGDLNGNGQLSVTGGSVYGEKYRFLTTNLQIHGRTVGVNNLVFAMDGGQVTGSADYNLTAKTAQFNFQGNGFDLSRIPRLQNAKYPIQGTVAFDAKGSGTLENPVLQASVHVRNLDLARESRGFVDADLHTEGHTAILRMDAHLNTATIDLTDRTQLTGDYQSEARLQIAKLDIDPLLRTFSVSGIRGNSSIAALVTVSGPMKTPKQLRGDIRISELNVNLEDVPIHSVGDIHATIADGTLRLDALHIVGTDTDLHAEGTVGLLGPRRTMQVKASGGVNMALLQTLDTNVISSGHVDFHLDATGTTSSPDLSGDVKFTNVNVALQDYINGLSRMNGSLVFYQNRLEFQDVTAYSGGGLIRLGGFVTYHNGLFADLTATAKGVRIRYPQGVTATADAKLTVQGTTNSSFISGTVTITGFAISPDVNFASVAASTNGVSLPPNPNSPTNHVRLDIRINSAPSLDFQNSFAKLAGNVSLTIRGTVAQPTVLGRVTITEGSATFNGAKFQLQHGDIYFSNPVRIQPIVDLIATTTVEDYNITISLQGTTDKLNPTFRSEPPLSEQDIFSLLAMGRTQEEEQIYSTEEAQAGVNSTADSLLGGALNATLSSRIQKLFGGGSVRIDPTFVSGIGNATARITITEPVSKQATLTYATNVNSTAEQLIQGEWRITPDFSVLAVRDESGVFSLVFRLHRRYR